MFSGSQARYELDWDCESPVGYQNYLTDTDRVSYLLSPRKRDQLLDLGCGIGNNSFRILSTNSAIERIIGVDLSLDYLRFAALKVSDIDISGIKIEGLKEDERLKLNALFKKRRASAMKSRGKVAHINADVEGLPLQPQSFDGAYAVQVLHWVKDLNGFLGEVSRVLKPGGEFVFDSTISRVDLGMEFRRFEEKMKSQGVFPKRHHPYYVAAVDEFNKIVSERGLNNENNATTGEVFRFTAEEIKNVCRQHGLSLVVDLEWKILKSGSDKIISTVLRRPPCLVYLTRENGSGLQDNILHGGHMILFRSEEMAALPNGEKVKILERINKSLDGRRDLLEPDYYSGTVLFKMKKL